MNARAPRMHTARETAVIIGGDCTERWLKDQARRRQVPFHMIAGRYNFSDDDIAEIERQARVRPGTRARGPARAPRGGQERPAAAPPPVFGPSRAGEHPVAVLTPGQPRRMRQAS